MTNNEVVEVVLQLILKGIIKGKTTITLEKRLFEDFKNLIESDEIEKVLKDFSIKIN